VVSEARVLFRWLLAAGIAAVPAFALSAELERTERSAAIERIQFNLLANASLVSRAATEKVPVPQWLTASGASNTTPIELTTPIPHGLATGDAVLVKGVQGNVAANGWWTITRTSETKFTLDGSVGSGDYSGGGSIFPSAGQPRTAGAPDSDGDFPWTPWFSAPAVMRETEFFAPLGEIYTFPELPPVNSFLSQEIDGSLFEPGGNLCLSIEARMPEAPLGDQRLKMVVTAALGTTRVYSTTIPASVLTPVYQRFALCFRLENDAAHWEGVLRVEFIDEHLRGIPKPMFWTRPMLNEGVAPAPWTASVPRLTRARAFY
jgi:hypothetical protein